ncbi:MAG: hypothetical protein PF545_00920 [Elusimicrobia bacterium]|jgi:hypothetical protein|nr:hypothetical protein [Elusimicrobiota bacterium]
MEHEKLVRKYKDELVSVYSIAGKNHDPSGIKRYAISTRFTRDFMNFPEIVNIDFTRNMNRGISAALTGINHLEHLSMIDSRSVNVYNILRGALNFQVPSALNRAFGYKWHSSSYISSQRVLKEGKFEISDDYYRKFIVPDNATIYSADIVASGNSLDNALKYLDAYMQTHNASIKNFVFFTIGCIEASRIMKKWHKHFKKNYPDYDRTILCYLEGRFNLAGEDTPVHNCKPDTDLLRNYKLGALLTPEYEFSQFEKLIIALEACVIYDGGKKGFEPVNHIKEIQGFWEKQLIYAEKKDMSLWDEYNLRFPLDHYFKDIAEFKDGSFGRLKEKKSAYWEGLTEDEYRKLYGRFKLIWGSKRIERAKESGSFAHECRKKIKYLSSLHKKLS